jgi:N-acetylneuraminic acid mutarotase
MRTKLGLVGLVVILAAAALALPSLSRRHPAAAQLSNPSNAAPPAAPPAPKPSTVAKRWSTLKTLPRESQHAGGAALGGWLYVVGGEDRGSALRKVQAYNPATNRWRQRALLPAARSREAVVVADSRIYAVAGASSFLTPTNTLYRYYPKTNTWGKRADLPTSLEGVAAAAGMRSGRETIFVFGGTDRNGAVRTDALAYDVAANSWAAIASMPVAVSDAQAVRIGSSVYVFAGLDASRLPSRALYIYDIASNTWSSGAPMRANSFGPVGAALGKDGRIYAIGLGMSAERVDAYIPSSNTWTTSPPNLAHPQAYPATATIGSWIYAAGGNPGSLTLSSERLEALKVS